MNTTNIVKIKKSKREVTYAERADKENSKKKSKRRKQQRNNKVTRHESAS